MLLTKKEIAKTIAENKERLQLLFAPYNPVTGEGSFSVPRFAFNIKADGSEVLHVPKTMMSDPIVFNAVQSGSLEKLVRRSCAMRDIPYNEHLLIQLKADFMQKRFDHDFEYWAFTSVKITDKDTGQLIPFLLNHPQRILLKDFERQRLEKIPIRTIITKARQWGGSTLTQMYFAWIQNRLKTGWGSVIVAHINNQARNIRSMYSKFAKEYPPQLGTISIQPYEGSPTTREVKERNCVMDITSIESPDSTRSFDYALCHLSEVGLWRGTLLKKPEDMVQNLRAGVKKVHLSMVVLESTAKGVGNFFHREWLDAKSGKSSYSPVFIPWHAHNKYLTKMLEEDYEQFIKDMSINDWERWFQGATLEGILWYNNSMKADNFDKWRMESEFPGDDEEAFQSTGNTIFHRKFLSKMEQFCRNPELKGELSADADKGKNAFNNIRFEEKPGGNLWVWAKPDKDILVKNRYVVAVDIGGTTEGADWSVIRVIDRYPILEGGVPETVATWKGHIDQDLLAWIAVQIAEWYNHALVVVESNSLAKEIVAAEGDHFLTVLDEIAEFYDNLYYRTSPEKIREGAPVLWGFHTNRQTKQLVIDNYKAVIRDMEYMETDARVIAELKSYQRFDDGTMGAVEGMHDDMVMSTGIGLYVSESFMSPPVVYTQQSKQQRKAKAKRKGKTITEATM